MFENFSNLIFIAVALAIFIGRTVAQARRKREGEKEAEKAPAPAPSPRPRVQALHFEEKDDDDVGYLKKKPIKTAKQPIKKQSAKPVSTLKKEIIPPANVEKLFPIKGTARAVSSEQQSGFSFNLDHLSPMKQAVVMAEILGPPKGMI